MDFLYGSILEATRRLYSSDGLACVCNGREFEAIRSKSKEESGRRETERRSERMKRERRAKNRDDKEEREGDKGAYVEFTVFDGFLELAESIDMCLHVHLEVDEFAQ